MASNPPCHLLDLPPELRLEIYGWLFDAALEVQLDVLDDIFIDADITGPPEAFLGVKLLQTCRIIHKEAEPILYHHAVFNLEVADGEERLDDDHLAVNLGSIHNCRYLLHRIRMAKLTMYSTRFPVDIGKLTLHIAAVLDAMEQGRHVKRLTIDFTERFYDWDEESDKAVVAAVCLQLESIRCEGEVILRGRNGASRLQLQSLAEKLGG